MGIGRAELSLLLHAKKSHIDFQDTLILGRHELLIGEKETVLINEYFGNLLDQSEIGSAAHDVYCEKLLLALGAINIESLDASDYEGASIVHDMNTPVPKSMHQKYSCIFDGGTTEHIFNTPQVFANIMNMLKIGGSFISITGGNNWPGHGLYQFSPELYFSLFSKKSGFSEPVVHLTNPETFLDWYKVESTISLRSRVEYTSAKKVMITCIAQKQAHMDIELPVLQQSDYSDIAWQQQPAIQQRVPEKISWIQKLKYFRKMRNKRKGLNLRWSPDHSIRKIDLSKE
jgi:hypothetical protein